MQLVTYSPACLASPPYLHLAPVQHAGALQLTHSHLSSEGAVEDRIGKHLPRGMTWLIISGGSEVHDHRHTGTHTIKQSWRATL